MIGSFRFMWSLQFIEGCNDSIVVFYIKIKDEGLRDGVIEICQDLRGFLEWFQIFEGGVRFLGEGRWGRVGRVGVGMEGGLFILGYEVLGMQMKFEREKGSQDYWREQIEFMVCY